MTVARGASAVPRALLWARIVQAQDDRPQVPGEDRLGGGGPSELPTQALRTWSLPWTSAQTSWRMPCVAQSDSPAETSAPLGDATWEGPGKGINGAAQDTSKKVMMIL